MNIPSHLGAYLGFLLLSLSGASLLNGLVPWLGTALLLYAAYGIVWLAYVQPVPTLKWRRIGLALCTVGLVPVLHATPSLLLLPAMVALTLGSALVIYHGTLSERTPR